MISFISTAKSFYTFPICETRAFSLECNGQCVKWSPCPQPLSCEARASGGSAHTSAEVHEDEHLPHVATAHSVDTRVNVAHNVLVPWQVPLWTRVEKYIVSYRHTRDRISTWFQQHRQFKHRDSTNTEKGDWVSGGLWGTWLDLQQQLHHPTESPTLPNKERMKHIEHLLVTTLVLTKTISKDL